MHSKRNFVRTKFENEFDEKGIVKFDNFLKVVFSDNYSFENAELKAASDLFGPLSIHLKKCARSGACRINYFHKDVGLCRCCTF